MSPRRRAALALSGTGAVALSVTGLSAGGSFAPLFGWAAVAVLLAAIVFALLSWEKART